MRLSILILCFLPLITSAAPTSAPAASPYPPCTAAQHDAYKVVGPDGVARPSWHPQIDQRQHCVFGHEHGSDPGLALPSAGWPYQTSPADVPFGYAAAKMGMTENHEGFKLFVFSDRAGHTWRLALHQGSSGAGRVCTRFHEVDVAIYDSNSWETLADTHFMGDFGKATSNQGQPLTPSACPTQAADAGGSTGVRQFQVYSQAGHALYDPWRLDDTMLTAIPLDLHALTIWPNSINDCQDLTCDVLVDNTNVYGLVNDGAERFFQHYPGMGIKAGGNRGVFYTDPMGMQLRQPTDPDAVRQYVKEGASFALGQPAGKCFQWGISAVYHCGGYSQGWPFANYSGAVQAPN